MTNEWSTFTIGEISEAIFDGPHATPTKTDSGPIFLGISNLQGGRIILEDVDHLAEEDFQKWTRRVTPQKGDIVFSYETRLGEAALVPDNLRFCLGRRMALIRPNKSKIDPRFLLYAYLGPEFQETIKARTIMGSTVDRIPLVQFPQFPITIPPLSEQRAIARILGALDDKIELNRKMNATLEAMAQALFKSWFVDFDPVSVKSEGRQPYGMNAETAALFPAEFVESGNEIFPLIPVGWELSSLDEIAHYENGLALQKHRPTGEDFLPVIKIRELRQGFADESSEKASPYIKSSCILYDGDMVFSWSGSLMIDLWCGGKGALNQHLFKVTSAKYSKWFYYFWTLFHLLDFQNIAEGKATTMGHIQRHHLGGAVVLVPNDELLLKADTYIQPMIDLIIKNRLQNRSLATIRDTLLPKLLSGEIRVRDAEKRVEQAV